MKRLWKPLVLAVVLAAGAATGFVATPAEAAGCPRICCQETGRCYSCAPTSWGGCVCPDIACP